ncbi:MAG: SNF2-related protein, partial [Gemmatimonadota bacterium]|nr:SNF2-related protein [Gemmatimonadota bacterium]
MHREHEWRLKYTREDGDLVRLFYLPALEDAKRYDRLTGYFRASALSLAARGVEGLVRNGGCMRLIVGCTLDPPEIEAIHEGERLRAQVDRHLRRWPLEATDGAMLDALELLAWMVARTHLDVKVAVPVDRHGKPVGDRAIFHEKTGIIKDTVGDRIAWTGSLNETASGWQDNWESISVYTDWGPERARVDAEEESFRRLWRGRVARAHVLDVPDAVRQDLLRFLPKDGPPARLRDEVVGPAKPLGREPEAKSNLYRERVWSFIRRAPSLQPGGDRMGEATAPIVPWPHQVRAFERLYRNWPPRLLIADEVGLGKTMQAGMLLRQAWLSGRAKRILVMVPAAVTRQWQVELYEKFNLNWPVYDGGKLTWHPPAAGGPPVARTVAPSQWHLEPVVIVSSHLMRRRERRAALLEDATPWDLIVLDEAHHARRRGAGGPTESGANQLLRLMRGLKDRTDGLVLLTATPMQVHPVELWDLLSLLGLPAEWTAHAFVEFFELATRPDVTPDAFETMARLFQAAERHGGPTADRDDPRLGELKRLKAGKVLRALRDRAETPRRQLDSQERAAALRLMKAHTPVRRLVSRHTRELLRRYHRAGLIDTRIADRSVEDRFLDMTADERDLYNAVEHYISTTYNRASESQRRAVGFVMTIYRRRLASSCRALRNTLRRRLDAAEGRAPADPGTWWEDRSDDEISESAQPMDADDVAKAEREALAVEEATEIRELLDKADRLPPDSKLDELLGILRTLRAPRGRHTQVMVFSQYTDTVDFLREELAKDRTLRLMCFTGRGGEVPGGDETWHAIDRDEAKRRFRAGEADVLLCSEAAAEGLNFQFCGALVNYDMPWNPMRVEQRIGRIDRLGQAHANIRTFNLHYDDTVEADIYRVLRERIKLFEGVVGDLQPILSRMSGTIASAVLAGRAGNGDGRAEVAGQVEREVLEVKHGIDIDEAVDADVSLPDRPLSPVTMDDLDRVIGLPQLRSNRPGRLRVNGLPR